MTEQILRQLIREIITEVVKAKPLTAAQRAEEKAWEIEQKKAWELSQKRSKQNDENKPVHKKIQLSSTFVISPDGKLHTDIGFHGNIIWEYPELATKATEFVKDYLAAEGKSADTRVVEHSLMSAISNGSDWLYDIIYTNGFIRCGKRGSEEIWITFNPNKTSKTALSTVMDIGKSNDLSKIDAYEEINNSQKRKENLSVDEFIEEYL